MSGRERAIWMAAILLSTISWGRTAGLVFVAVPVAALHRALRAPAAVRTVGTMVVMAHLGIFVIIARSDAPDENRALAPLTALVVDFAIVGVGFVADWVLERRRR